MILICIIALSAIAFRLGLGMHQQPIQTYDPSFITYHGSLWSPTITVTNTPMTYPISEPKQPIKQCIKFEDQQTLCQ
jgi:hypothetical protein